MLACDQTPKQHISHVLPCPQLPLLHRPHALLVYVAHLQRLMQRTGQPAAKVQAFSCYSLYNGPSRELYDSRVNLLELVGRYEGLFGSGGALH